MRMGQCSRLPVRGIRRLGRFGFVDLTQMSGLGVLDTSRRLEVAKGANTISEKGDGFYRHGPNGEPRAGINVNEKDEKDGALFLNDTKGGRRACSNVNGKGSSLYRRGANGECRSGFGAYEDEKAGLRDSQPPRKTDISSWGSGTMATFTSSSPTRAHRCRV
jgi:hypothetical protein